MRLVTIHLLRSVEAWLTWENLGQQPKSKLTYSSMKNARIVAKSNIRIAAEEIPCRGPFVAYASERQP